MITCVGFAPSPDRAIVIPFYDEEKPDGNYWPTPREEYNAWQFVRRCLRAGKRLGGQNFQYDMQYLWRQMGIKSPDFADDTMLMHHALQPEMQKGLGFLASVYTDELAWKFMHKTRHADKSAKKASTE
jgi:DNA polymerase I-like protein with 3'-5' exonuclease and polymerase domains